MDSKCMAKFLWKKMESLEEPVRKVVLHVQVLFRL